MSGSTCIINRSGNALKRSFQTPYFHSDYLHPGVCRAGVVRSSDNHTNRRSYIDCAALQRQRYSSVLILLVKSCHSEGDRAAPLRPPHTQALRRRAEGGAADAPLLGRRQPTSTTGAACENAIAGRGYFGVPVPAQPPNGLCELYSYTARERLFFTPHLRPGLVMLIARWLGVNFCAFQN
jgi:hypothetical protein